MTSLVACVPARAGLGVLVLASCQLPGSASRSTPPPALPHATISLAETHYAHGHLFASIETEQAARVTLTDDRAGSPRELGTFDAPRGGCALREPTDGQDELDDRSACAWSLPDARPGHYTIRVATMTGTPLATAGFDLIEVPAAGGRRAVIVDPAVRIARPYQRGEQLWVWWPIDARFASRSVMFFSFADGSAKLEDETALAGPSLQAAGDPAITVSAARFDHARLDDSFAITAGRTFLGAWRMSGASFLPITLTPAQTDQLHAALEARIAKTTVEYGHKIRISTYTSHVVPRICAVIASPAAVAIVDKLDASKSHATATTQYSQVGSVSVGGTSYDVMTSGPGALISGSRHWQTDRTSHGVMKEESRAFTATLAQLDALGRPYRTGCPRLFATMPWLLADPATDEADFSKICGPRDGCPERSGS
jgi:hypothetical protein